MILRIVRFIFSAINIDTAKMLLNITINFIFYTTFKSKLHYHQHHFRLHDQRPQNYQQHRRNHHYHLCRRDRYFRCRHSHRLLHSHPHLRQLCIILMIAYVVVDFDISCLCSQSMVSQVAVVMVGGGADLLNMTGQIKKLFHHGLFNLCL